MGCAENSICRSIGMRGFALNPVIGFSGAIASGKTTLARKLAEEEGFVYASFGDFVRYEATKLGYDPSNRELLQDHGSKLIEEGWERFCLAVLEFAGWVPSRGLVIDGIRHGEAVEALRRIVSPQPFYLVYVLIDEKVRNIRLQQREINLLSEIKKIDEHSTEQQVKERLFSLSDVVINGAEVTENSLIKLRYRIVRPS